MMPVTSGDTPSHSMPIAAAKHGGLLVVFGRRRVGKTRLLRQWLQAHNGLYSQAIEAQRDVIDAIEYMQLHYRVDRARIYLVGRSMGGMLAEVMAANGTLYRIKPETLFDGRTFDPAKPEEYAKGFEVNNLKG